MVKGIFDLKLSEDLQNKHHCKMVWFHKNSMHGRLCKTYNELISTSNHPWLRYKQPPFGRKRWVYCRKIRKKAKTERNLVSISAIIHRDDEFNIEVRNLLKDWCSFNMTACFNPRYHSVSKRVHRHFKGTITLANVFTSISAV